MLHLEDRATPAVGVQLGPMGRCEDARRRLVSAGMETPTGSTARDTALEEARRHVRRKRIFFTILGIWLALCLMWFAIDMLDDSSSFWFYWPMLGTGIGVAITAVVLLGIGGLLGVDWERREIEKYLRHRGNRPSG
jgi:2TM domain